MCIIVCKPAGVEMPAESILNNCFDNNSDGAGYAYVKNNEIYIRKGFMTFEAFMDDLKKTEKSVSLTDADMILHFRIGTGGGNTPANTHPFPVSHKMENLQRTRYKTDVAVVMNGIVDLVNLPKNANYSDTMAMIQDDFSFLKALNKNFYKHQFFDAYIESKGAKWAFLDKTGITMYGFFIKDNGCYYSNNTYSYSYSDWCKPYKNGCSIYYPSYSASAGAIYNDYLSDDLLNILELELTYQDYLMLESRFEAFEGIVEIEYEGKIYKRMVHFEDDIYYYEKLDAFYIYDYNTLDILEVKNMKKHTQTVNKN